MRVPFTDIRVEYMDTPERKVLDLRRDGIKEVPMLGWCNYSRARPDLPAHCHKGVIEVHYLDRGQQFFEVEGQEYHLHGGDLFVTRPGEVHSTGGRPVKPCVLYWLNLRVPKPGRTLLLLPPRETVSLLEALQSLPQRHFRGSPMVKGLFDILLNLHSEPQVPLHRTRMRQALVQLLLEIIDCAAQLAVRDPVSSIKRIAQMIEGRPAEEFQIRTLAQMAGLSLSWFKTRFKEQIGLSPRQFILRTKVNAACRRLLASDESITKIGGELGFPTSQYFATVFRRMMGVPPKTYRLEDIARGPSHRGEDGQR